MLQQLTMGNSRTLKVGQLNLQNSRVGTTEARRIVVDEDLNLLLAEEPYS